MQIYLSTLDFDILTIIEDGYSLPMTIDEQTRERKFKPKREWTSDERSLFQLNGKAMNVLYCALDRSEYNRVLGCDTAKSIWDMLEVTHEGTSRVKDSKISMLVYDYELFSMKPHESIKDMYTQFTDIINGLKKIGRAHV